MTLRRLTLGMAAAAASSTPALATGWQQVSHPQAVLSEQRSPGRLAQTFSTPVMAPDDLAPGSTPEAVAPGTAPAKAVPPMPAQTVDVRGIWYALQHGKVALAWQDANRLRAEHPDWQPDEDLLRALVTAAVRQAEAQADHPQILQLAARSPRFFDCDDPGNAWAVAAAELATGKRTAAIARYLDLAGHCAEADVRQASMQRALSLADPDLRRALEAMPATAQIQATTQIQATVPIPATAPIPAAPGAPGPARHTPAGLPLVAKASAAYGKAVVALSRRDREGPPEDAWRMAEHLGAQVVARRDAPVAELIGWVALHANRPEDAATWFAWALDWAPSASARDGAMQALIAAHRDDEAEIVFARYGGGEEQRRPLAEGFAERARALLRRGESARALAAADKAASFGAAKAFGDLGWIALERGDPALAARLFARAPRGAKNDHGLALALMRAGRRGEATTQACGHATEGPDLARLCGDLLTEEANRLQTAKDWRGVIDVAAKAKSYGVGSPALASLAAWATLNSGDADGAAQRFDALYAATPSEDSAEGLTLSLAAAGQVAALKARAGDPGPLGARIAGWFSDRAYERGQLLRAHTLAPDRHQDLAGIDAPLGQVAGFFRTTQGDAGQGRLDLTDQAITGSLTRGVDRFSLRIDLAHAEIGRPAPGAPIGSFASPTWTTTPTSSATLAMPRLGWERQGDGYDLKASLGTTPLGGAVGARPAGAVSATLYQPKYLLNGRLFSESRWDSLLAASGLRDPVSGESFGRVVESGADLAATALLSDRLSATLSGRAAILDGQGVARNEHLRLGLASAYDFKLAGFAYLRVGPYYSFENYTKNLNRYTQGAGGYFSPQEYHGVGLAADLSTEQGRSWLIQGRASAGWARFTEGRSGLVPLSGRANAPGTVDADGYLYPERHRQGFGVELSLKGAAQLSPHWTVSGLTRASTSPQYRDYALGAALTYHFAPRAGLFSIDLPGFFDRGS